MPAKTYAQLTLNTQVASAPNDLVAAYPVGGPLYAITFINFCKSITQLGALTAPLVTTASVAGAAGLNVPPGVAPSAPNNGDIWTTASGVFVRYGGATQPLAALSGATFSGELFTAPSTSGGAGLNLGQGSAPAGPANGDLWITSAGVFARYNGSTVQLSSGSVVTYVGVAFFGDGSDGNVTINGVTTLSRDMFYANLTIAAGAALNTNGWRIYVAGTLDLTAASAGGISRNGNTGGAASGTGSGGSAASALNGNSLATSPGSNAGKAGTTGAGANGASISSGGQIGGSAGSAGAGGAGSNPGGNAATATANSYTPVGLLPPTTTTAWPQPGNGAGAGCSGGAGGGDGTSSGGASGGGGGGGGLIFVAANIINRGAGTAVGTIQSLGAAAGAGFAPTAGNAGGAGGSGGGGGGAVLIIANSLSGTTATNCIDVTGGNGAAGTVGFGTGLGGDGGASGMGGRVWIVNLTTGGVNMTVPIAAVAGGAHNGINGGSGAAATTSRVSL